MQDNMSVNALSDAVSLYGLTDLDIEVLIGLCLEEECGNLPITKDGRLAKEAFGRDVCLTIIGRNANGTTRVQEQSGNGVDKDGAPGAVVYRALVSMGLARDSDGRCAWVATAAGRAVASHL